MICKRVIAVVMLLTSHIDNMKVLNRTKLTYDHSAKLDVVSPTAHASLRKSANDM